MRAVHFLGVGSAEEHGLGHSSIVVELGENKLLVDCGPRVLQSYLEKYHSLPEALFVTHCHLDHIADLEKLFFKAWFSERKIRPILFVPVEIVGVLHQRIASYPGTLAEGGVNFWQAFQLVPVSESFVFAGVVFHLYPARHHAPNSAFSLHLPGAFFYTGDSRPIPDVISHRAVCGELIFHDSCLKGNPSHTGLEDLLREYSPKQLQRMWVYHYQNSSDREVFTRAGIKCALTGDTFSLCEEVKSAYHLRSVEPTRSHRQQAPV